MTQTFLGGGKCSFNGTDDTSSLNMLPSTLAQLPDMKEKSLHTHKKNTPLDTSTPPQLRRWLEVFNGSEVFKADKTLQAFQRASVFALDIISIDVE